MEPITENVSGMYRRGFNDAVEGAKRYLELNVEIGELEAHECPDPDCINFQHCPACEDISLRTSEQREIVQHWARQWAQQLLRSQNTLPVQTWCECGHISGHHGVEYPHVCATGGNDGCENGCTGFKPQRVLTKEDIERIGANATKDGSAINRNPRRL
jgi:hypothetical protein